MESTIRELKSKYEEAGQGQVLQWIDQLKGEELENFVSELKSTDPIAVNKRFQRVMSQNKVAQMQLQPFPDVCLLEESAAQRKEWEKLGLEMISKGKAAVLLLAGGQGTRLGTSNPKGMYKVGFPSGKSLYQIQAERILKLQQLANQANNTNDSVVPWYIMTSEATGPLTKQYFKDNNYFGLAEKDFFFFEQAMIPCITPEGKIIMESKGKIAKAPNGNGGTYEGIRDSGALADMEKRGVQYVYIYGVDNCLIKMADPAFFGYCAEKNIEVSAKVVPKASPEEAVGVVCLNNGLPVVIEYSEIDKELAKKIDPKTGKLFYNTAHICMNMYSFNFLKDLCTNKLDQLPFHIAKKKIPCANAEGNTVTPDVINGWKLEMFIFDVFEFASKMSCFEVLRNEEFSPLKNANEAKVDCPNTCIQDLSALHKSWLKKAGAILENESELCEVSPSVSYSGEGLESYNGKVLRLPLYLQ